MTDYKLVPVEPTPEMLEAGEYAQYTGCYVSGIYADMLAAAPAVQGEPVGEVRLELGAPSVVYGELYSEAAPHLVPGTLLYTAPQPAPDVPGLTEALRQYQHNDGSGLVFGYDKLLVDQYVAGLVEALEASTHRLHEQADGEDDCRCSQCRFVRLRDAALAAHRKQGD